MGIEVTFVDDPHDLEQWRAAIRPNTKAFFGEVLANPRNDVFDIEGVSKVAHDNGIPLIVDNTVPTPYLIRPIEWGADIVVHSLTKFIGGHGTSIGGAIIDGGTFDFGASGRFPNFTEPDPSYHGLPYWPALGHGAFIIKARVQMLRDLGMRRSRRSTRSCSCRASRRSACAWSATSATPTRWPSSSSIIRRSRAWPTPGSRPARGTSAPRSTAAARATAASSRSTSRRRGQPAKEAGQKFVEALKLHSHVANIGDVRSLVIHPASTTHSQLTEEEQAATGVRPGLVRLSVGLESIDDILADLELGFAAVK